MASGNKIPYVISVELQGDIAKSQAEMQKLSKTLNSAFTTRTNVGQSIAADLRDIDKILERIKTSSNKPIRGDWGMETLINDTENAGRGIDKLIKKIEDLRDFGNKSDRLKLIDENQVKTFEKLQQLTTSIGGGMKNLQKAQETYNELIEKQKELENRKDFNENKKLSKNPLMQFSAKNPNGVLFKNIEQNIGNIDNQIAPIMKKYFNGKKFSKRFGEEYASWELKLEENQFEANKAVNSLKNKPKALLTEQEQEDLKQYKKQLKEATEALEELRKAKKAYDNEAAKKTHNKEVESIRAEVAENKAALQEQADILKNALKDNNGNVIDFSLTQEQINSIQPLLQQLGITVGSTGLKFSELEKYVADADVVLDEQAKQVLTDLINKLNNEGDAARKAADGERDLKDQTKRSNEELSKVEGIKNRIAMFTGFYGSLNLIRKAVRQAITTIKELDEQMTQMAVVTSSTISDYWKQLPEYTRRANEFGMAIKDVYAADTLYYQQGLKTQQVIEVSNETLKLARIAALDTAEATDRLTAAMRGFSMVVGQESAERVNDVFSKLAAITASNVEEISKAMTKTASIAHSAGMEFETTAAFLSQIIETTRESAETAGTAMKTVIARFGELKKAPSEIGEIEGEVVDANKIETALRSVGIALRDAQGQFRDLDDVFLELSAKWEGLDKNTQRYIATIAAGSRQQSRFIAMMQNYSRTMELVNAANNSAGTSTEQFAKTMDSLKNKLNGFKNAWDTFTMGILQSEVLKKLVDAGTAIINLINKIFEIIDKLNMPLLGAVTRVSALIGLMYGLKKVLINGVIPGIINLIKMAKGEEIVKKKDIDLTSRQTIAQKAYADELGRTLTFKKMLSGQGVTGAAFASGNVGTGLQMARLQAGEKIKSAGATVGSSIKEGVSAIWGNLKLIFAKIVALLPYIAMIGAAIAAIVVLIKVITGLINKIKFNSQEEVFKRDKEALQNYQKAVENLKSAMDDLNSSKEKYISLNEELSKLTINTVEWKNQLIKVNDEVLNIVKNYKELAPYVSRNPATGQLIIADEGWNAITLKQKKDLEKLQRLEIKQQRKVYQNEAIVKKQNFFQTYGNDLGLELYGKSTEELQNLLLDNSSIEDLSATFDESQATVRGAISQLIENREAMQLNTEQLNVLSQNLSSEEEQTAPQIAIERRVNEKISENYNQILKQFRKGTTYEFNDIFKQILKDYNVDEMTVKGKSDKELLAGIAGIVEGLSWKEGVEKYSSQTGFWSGTRGDMEEYVIKTYLEKKYTDEVTEDENFTKSYSKATTMFLNGDIGNIPIEDLKNMEISQADVEAAVEAGILNKQKYSGIKDDTLEDFLVNVGQGSLRYYSVNQTYEEDRETYKKIEEAFKKGEDLAETIRRLYKEAGRELSAESYAEIQSRLNYNALDPEEVARDQLRKIYSGYFESYNVTPYGQSYYDPNKSKYSAQIQDSFEQLSSTVQKALLDRIDRMWQRNNQDYTKLGEFDAIYGGMTSNLSSENERKFADILNLYDWTNKDDLEKMRSQLKKEKDTFGYTESQIDNFINTLDKLNKAVKQIDLTELINGLNSFGNIVNQLRIGTFEGKFSEEEYKKMIENYSHLFNPEDFVKTLEGNYIFKGTNEQLQKLLTSTFDIPIPAKELVDATGKQLSVFEKIGDTKEIYEETVHALQDSLKESLGEMPEETRNAIIDGLGLTGIWDMESASSELIEAVRIFYEKWILKQDENKEVIAHYDELRGQALGVAQENAYQLTQKYSRTTADSLYGQLKGNAAISEADLNNFVKLNQIMAEGGDRAKIYKEEWKELITRMANAAGVNKAANNMKNSASKIKGALDSIGDSVIDTHAELNELQETLAHFNIQGIEDLDYETAEAYKSLFSFIQEGSEEAYNNLIQLVALSNGGAEDSIEILKQEGSLINDTTGELTKLALLFEQLGFGHIDAEAMNFHFDDFQAFLDELNGKDKDKDKDAWENPYDWLWNITEAINKQIYLRERLERRYTLAVENSVKTTQDLYNISEKELENLNKQAQLEKTKGENARLELQMLMDEYSEYAKYVSANPLTGQVQVDYEALDHTGWDSNKGSAFESFVSRVTELSDEIEDSVTTLEDIEDTVKEIRDRGKKEFIDFENRIKEDLVSERQAEIDTMSAINDSVTKAQNDMLESMREQIDETRRIRENTDKQEEIEKKRQRLAYLQRDTSGANQTEILSLQDEIQKEEQQYTDTLIDQSLENLQKENEKAAEMRQQQIDIANFQLTVWQETGEIWKTVRTMLDNYFAGGQLKQQVETLIRTQENWTELSELQRQIFDDELAQQGKLAQLFDESQLSQDGSAILAAVESYSSDLQKQLSTGPLGKTELDDGKWWPVTLKDYNPKDDDDKNNSGMGKTLSAIFELLRDKFLPKLNGTQGTDSQRANFLASIGQTLQLGQKGTQTQLENIMGGKLSELPIEALIELDSLLRTMQGNIFLDSNKIALQNIYKKWNYKKYASGGLNTQTGPAWLDGTPSKPEPVLNAEQGRAFYTLVNGVSALINSNNQGNLGGDNYFEVNIQVDELANDYDVEQVAEKIKQMIVEDSNYRNVNFITGLR